jgi:AcrR family transcriptional regulator
VDEIARKAGANKAMIYYHFGTKQELYQAVVLQLFSGVLAEVDRIGREVADPEQRLMAFYEGLVRSFGRQAVLPRIMMRELLAGGAHMDAAMAQVLAGILRFVGTALDDGRRRGSFRRLNPILVHLSMMGPILVYFVSEPVRKRLLPTALPPTPLPTEQALIEHLRETLARMLAADKGGNANGS